MSDKTVKFMIAVILILLGVIVTSYIPNAEIKAQDGERNFQALLQELIDNDVTFTVAFATPVWADSFWQIPEAIEYEGNIIGRRLIKEIGEDFLCVEEIGQGATFVYCVPFSNISDVRFFPYSHT